MPLISTIPPVAWRRPLDPGQQKRRRDCGQQNPRRSAGRRTSHQGNPHCRRRTRGCGPGDLDLTKDQKARELAYADHRTAELGLNWDDDQLKEDLTAGVQLDKFWNEMELTDLLDGEEENTPEQAAEDGPPQMELQPLERYDYNLVLPRNSIDFKIMCEALDIGPVTFPPRGLKKQRTIRLGRCIDAKRLLRKLGKL